MQQPLSQPGLAVSVRDVVYRHAADRELRALIYQPQGKGLFPALVCVHGGAWVSGDRTATEGLAKQVAACGIVVMAVDFRMAPRDPYPSSLVDINYATRWLKQHAAEYAVAPAAIGGLGVSSGGQLILLSALRPHDARYTQAALEDHGDADATLAFVITCSGVLDPLARYRMAQKLRATDILACHKAYFGSESVMAEASPALILERGEAVCLPSALFFQGGLDQRLPSDTAQRVANLYLAAGGQAEALVYPGVGHALGEWGKTEVADLLTRIAQCITLASR